MLEAIRSIWKNQVTVSIDFHRFSLRLELRFKYLKNEVHGIEVDRLANKTKQVILIALFQTIFNSWLPTQKKSRYNERVFRINPN